MVESKVGADLKKFLKKHILKKELTDELAVMDSKLGGVIKDEMGIQVRHQSARAQRRTPPHWPSPMCFLHHSALLTARCRSFSAASGPR